ncbi:tartrate dehydrogenase [Actinopolymorpha alba]|uniref:tartrate dehydrogenase n=1 Tax=Actinopolymorpha alba TaxID=533267 RepID=UPI0003737670|nr:tartrate dehydrogenase [Actinopolymorpha alba]
MEAPVRTHRIAVIPGDGIGVEVTAEALRVVDAAASAYDFAVEWTAFDWSCERYTATGQMMPDDGLDQLRPHDAILLGAVGYPGVPDHISLWGLLIPIRRAFEQYVNLRPVRLLPGVASPLAGRAAEDLAMIVVRENSEGEYSRIGGRQGVGDDELAIQSAVFTRRGVERVVRYAFELARSRGLPVCSATKSNGIVFSMPFWDEIFSEVAVEYPDVPSELCHADALAARMVLAPDRLGVIVASNLFGDLLSDLSAAVVGGLGIAPAANLNPERTHPSMFEAVHGSAPDIAGKGIANPVAQILTAAMMLDHLGETAAAAGIERAVDAALADLSGRTPDLGGSATTVRCTDAVIAALASAP